MDTLQGGIHMDTNSPNQEKTFQQLYDLVKSQNNKLEQLQKEVSSQTQKLEHLETISTSQKNTIVELINVINTYTSYVLSVCVAWKKDIQQKYELSNSDVGTSRIDDEAIIELTKLGLSGKAIAKKLGCSEWSVYNHKKVLKEQGRL